MRELLDLSTAVAVSNGVTRLDEMARAGEVPPVWRSLINEAMTVGEFDITDCHRCVVGTLVGNFNRWFPDFWKEDEEQEAAIGYGFMWATDDESLGPDVEEVTELVADSLESAWAIAVSQ